MRPSLPAREQSHVHALATVIDAGSVAGLAAAREHLATYPRDAMVLAPCTGVFGLIGFSGLAGREAELLALVEPLAEAYGDGRVKRGDLVLMEALGGGMTWGSALVRL